jgi:hypothetical protein
MKKYCRKPIIIEAVQYTGHNDFEINQWSKGKVIVSPVLEPTEDNPTGSYLQVETLEGVMTAIIDDWIIKGIKGEFYLCKPDIFEATYEEVKDEKKKEGQREEAIAYVLKAGFPATKENIKFAMKVLWKKD